MKKEFEGVKIEIQNIDVADVITTSPITDSTEPDIW